MRFIRYGRHPPPNYLEWYEYARARQVQNIDDFDQIMGDLRPFWAIPPQTIRSLAAHMHEKDDGIGTIHIRQGRVAKISAPSWRPETMATVIEKFVQYLPDMDIAVNVLDQPRVVVPFEDLQQQLDAEFKARQIHSNGTHNKEFTPNMAGLLDLEANPDTDNSTREDAKWFGAGGRQYMNIAKLGCPPESPANGGTTTQDTEVTWKDPLGGIITNVNRSRDLCTLGPDIQDKHGFLFAPSSIIATNRLVPVFSECKVNVNNDILFPANMYWKHDVRFDYTDNDDLEWERKEGSMLWRGVTSGGVQFEDNWFRMHRQRLVQLMNSTVMENKTVTLLSENPPSSGQYDRLTDFQPSNFLSHRADVGFSQAWGCIPDGCAFYDNVLSLLPQVEFGKQFNHKFLVDVDGHTFSGRWRAFLESKSLGIKSTIFQEWHDSRLLAWKHFVPLDTRYDDIFSILTYFMGLEESGDRAPETAYVPPHDLEAKRLAWQGREWAKKALRREDIEASSLRLR